VGSNVATVIRDISKSAPVYFAQERIIELGGADLEALHAEAVLNVVLVQGERQYTLALSIED